MTKMTLAECPPGLFHFNDTLCFKSEYTTTLENPRRYQCDAYVVESGEYFHGGTAGDVLARSNLLVEPLYTPSPDSGERMREALRRIVALSRVDISDTTIAFRAVSIAECALQESAR